MIKVATGATKCGGGAHAACFKPRRGTRRSASAIDLTAATAAAAAAAAVVVVVVVVCCVRDAFERAHSYGRRHARGRSISATRALTPPELKFAAIYRDTLTMCISSSGAA